MLNLLLRLALDEFGFAIVRLYSGTGTIDYSKFLISLVLSSVLTYNLL